MPWSDKDILCIIASDDILEIELSKYLSSDIGQVICDKDSLLYHQIASWARKNKIECCSWKKSSLYEETDLDLYISMIDFSDKVCFFWNGEEDACGLAAKYAQERDIKNIVHIVNYH